MADKKHLFRDYFKCFLLNRYDIHGKDLSEIKLKKLLPQLSENETALIQEFKAVTQQIYDIMSEEVEREGTPEDKAILDSYEQLADRGEIPVDARRQMYGLILDARDKYVPGHQGYLKILQKKINLMQKKDFTDLKLAYMQIHLHSWGVDPNFVHSLEKEVYKKNPANPFISPDKAAALAKEIQIDKRDERYKFYQNISAGIDTQLADSIPPQERAELLEKKYEIIGKTGIGRLKAAQQKLNIAGELQFLFNSMDNYEKEGYYSREAETQEEQIRLINRHINRGKQR